MQRHDKSRQKAREELKQAKRTGINQEIWGLKCRNVFLIPSILIAVSVKMVLIMCRKNETDFDLVKVAAVMLMVIDIDKHTMIVVCFLGGHYVLERDN